MNVVHVLSERGPYARSAEKREARADEILDEAMRLLAADGLERLTLARIGKGLGYVPAALYRYFPSKDALVAALQRRAVAEIRGVLSTARAQATADSKRRRLPDDAAALYAIVASARAYLELPRTNPEAHLLVAILLGDPRALLSDDEALVTAPLLLALLAEVRELFAQAAALGALEDGDAMARTLAMWASLQGALALAKARRFAQDLPGPVDVGLDATRALLTGWGAPRALLRRIERNT